MTRGVAQNAPAEVGSGPGYRPDIDGLRALAVLLVLLFHAGFDDWSGGYVGVDVFFVISGFLIAALLVDRPPTSVAAALEFLARRLARLAPAALPVVAATLMVAAATLPPPTLDAVAASAVAAATYWANYYFQAQVGYFDVAPQTKPLLHFWSLAVEMHCYLFVALLAALASAVGGASGFRRRFATAVGAAVLASAAISAFYFAALGREAAFFASEARFVEFGSGALLALVRGAAPLRFGAPLAASAAMRLAGLGLIVAAALGYDAAQSGPGLHAAAPALGAALILAAPAAPRDPTYWALTAPPLVWLGLISYSLYLWHWPVLAFFHFHVERVGDGEASLALALSAALAAASYRLIERPARRRLSALPPPARLARLGAAVAACCALAAAAPTANAWRFGDSLVASRLSTLTAERDAARARGAVVDGGGGAIDPVAAAAHGCSYNRGADVERLQACLLAAIGGAGPEPFFLVLGDSHAQDAFHALRQAYPSLRFAYLHQGGGCGPATHRSLRLGGGLCFAGLDALVAGVRLRRPLAGVIASTRYYGPLEDGPSYALKIAETRRSLGAPTARLLILGPAPIFRRSIERYLLTANAAKSLLLEQGALPVSEFAQDLHDGRRRMQVIAAQEDMTFFDRLAPFCSDISCEIFDFASESFLMTDSEHLTVVGLARLAIALRDDAAVRTFFAASAAATGKE